MIKNELLEKAIDAIEIDFARSHDRELLEAIGFVRDCIEDYETLIEALKKSKN